MTVIGLLYWLVTNILNYQVKLTCNSSRSILHNLTCKLKYFYSFFILMFNKTVVKMYVVLSSFYILVSYVLKKTQYQYNTKSDQ